jgi:hypothetical protein
MLTMRKPQKQIEFVTNPDRPFRLTVDLRRLALRHVKGVVEKELAEKMLIPLANARVIINCSDFTRHADKHNSYSDFIKEFGSNA